MSNPRQILVRMALWGPLVAAVTLLLAWLLLPWPLVYRWRDPEVTSLMQFRQRQWEEEKRAPTVRHTWVSLKDVSPAVVRSVVAAEDGRFRRHGGVDWVALGEEVHYDGSPPFSWFDLGDLQALGRAVAWGWSHRHEIKGRSTITQQLAKNLYFTPERSVGRKVAELVVAWRLEWLLSKDRILELYLNSVELGPGIFGVEAAAREYFGTSAAGLDLWQAASLAATLPHPLTSNPAYRPARMAWRRDLILERLRRGSAADASPIPEAPPTLAEPELPDTVGPSAPVGAGRRPRPDSTADTLGSTPPDTAGGTLRMPMGR